MTPYLVAADNIFPWGEFLLLREYAWKIQYQDKTGPDGVTYQNIGIPVPPSAHEQLTHALSWLMGYRVILKICAFRLSTEGTEPPQWAHSDAEVANWASFVYVNEGPGGTVLLRHKDTEMTEHPKNQAELDAWNRDCNKQEAWEIIGSVPNKPNRGIVIPAKQIHAAMPVRGFGQSPIDGRLILWSFFD
jgi:hypothetical protein